MNINRKTKATLLAFTCAVALAACTASDSTDTAASATPVISPAPAPVVDPNAINQPIAAEAYKVRLSLADAPVLSADGSTITYQVQVKNEGTAPIYGVGDMAVNLGWMILGDDGKVDGPGGVRDFSRTPLPLVQAGQTVTVMAQVPADVRLNGRKLRLATVQEAVAWHDEANTADVGPFHVSDGKFTTLATSQ